MIKQIKKNRKIVNWSKYNKSLVMRGSLEIWIDKDTLDIWHTKPTGKRGAQEIYSDEAIEMVLIAGKIYHQRLRQTEGFVRSAFKLMGLQLEIPDYSTLSRRGKTLKVQLKILKKEKVIMIMDSTGLKVFGEGEWKVRRHGYSKHRTWMKLHIGIDKDGEIRAVKLTGNNVTDADAGLELIDQEKARIVSLVGDGGYDRMKIYEKCEEREIEDVKVPPQKNARIKIHGNSKLKHKRDENLRAIRKSTRKNWKKKVGYHVRSLVETAMYRTKVTFGDHLNAHNDSNQKTEVEIMCKILNVMKDLGMPKYEIGQATI